MIAETEEDSDVSSPSRSPSPSRILTPPPASTPIKHPAASVSAENSHMKRFVDNNSENSDSAQEPGQTRKGKQIQSGKQFNWQRRDVIKLEPPATGQDHQTELDERELLASEVLFNLSAFAPAASATLPKLTTAAVNRKSSSTPTRRPSPRLTSRAPSPDSFSDEEFEDEDGDYNEDSDHPSRPYNSPPYSPTSPARVLRRRTAEMKRRVEMEQAQVLSPSITSKPKKKRGNLPEFATRILKQWIFEHSLHPYPTEEEKAELEAKTNLSLNQVNNWFTNARRRILPKKRGHGSSRVMSFQLANHRTVFRTPRTNAEQQTEAQGLSTSILPRPVLSLPARLQSPTFSSRPTMNSQQSALFNSV